MNSSEERHDGCLTCEFQENLDMLRDNYFFSALSIEVLKVLAYLCSREKFRTGESLFSQGEDDGLAFFIISGKARLTRRSDNGENIIKGIDSGMFIGGFALIGKLRRLFSLVAETDMECLVLSRERFLKAMEQFPDELPKILNALVARLVVWEGRLLKDIEIDCRQALGSTGASLL
ncbi:MAG: Crp/Fnr family transcriptional regulator [Desulfobacteraceae bacterium]|nr:MAG: Crp/Fnr family transcriptional regulator [Desulfobacteraceae bacterium]